MIVVLDTNIWIKEMALNSNIGSAVRYYLKNQDICIGLPEVIELETKNNLRAYLYKLIKDAEDSHRKLLSVFGELEELIIPTSEDVDGLVSTIFDRVGVDIIRQPFTKKSARKSLMRTIEKIPPSDRGQQFKDGVIWEDCLKILEEDDVKFVTEDKAFYKNRDYSKGLVLELEKDLEDKGHQLHIFNSLESLLTEIQTLPSIESELLINAYYSNYVGKATDWLVENDIAIHEDEKPNLEFKAYATEDPKKLYVSFDINQKCLDLSGNNRHFILIFSGDTYFDTKSNQFDGITRRSEELFMYDKRGEKNTIESTKYAALSIVIGHRMVKHEVRYNLGNHQG